MTGFRSRLKDRNGLTFVGAPSALAAKLIERHGFDGVYLSGAGLAMNGHGVPDDGTITLEQAAANARIVCAATSLPAIVDADTGFADGPDVSVCIRALEAAGAAAIQIEDQVSAKKCGHLEGKQLVPLELMADKVRSAVAARRNPELAIVARTDARGVTGYADALSRARAYREAGADLIFIESPESAEEFRRFAEECPGPLMANMTEFGKSPLLDRAQLADYGYTVVIYPVTLLRVMMAAADEALATLRRDDHQRALLPGMWTRKQLYDAIGYDEPVPDPPRAPA